MVGAELTPDTHHGSSKMLAGNSIIARVSHNTTMYPLEGIWTVSNINI